MKPEYQTKLSSGADLKSSISTTVPAGGTAKVPTGVWIEEYSADGLAANVVPELQIRARSGLAYKHGINLSNGVGTIDIDYADEICVLLTNTSSKDFRIEKGDRVAQMVLALSYRIPELCAKGKRDGGFGSTGLNSDNNVGV